jgi:hypothetical protein
MTALNTHVQTANVLIGTFAVLAQHAAAYMQSSMSTTLNITENNNHKIPSYVQKDIASRQTETHFPPAFHSRF